MTETYEMGDLVYFTDLQDETLIAVILAEGRSGYGFETKLIYVVYVLATAETVLAYDWEIDPIQKSD